MERHQNREYLSPKNIPKTSSDDQYFQLPEDQEQFEYAMAIILSVEETFSGLSYLLDHQEYISLLSLLTSETNIVTGYLCALYLILTCKVAESILTLLG